MTAVIGAVAIIGIAGYLMAKFGQWVAAQWFIVRAWRWFSGQAHHGKPVTNAGWFRRGYGQALTATGHATWWWYLPRWQRAWHRMAGTFTVVFVTWAFLANPSLTSRIALSVVFLAAVIAAALCWRWTRHRKLRRSWLHPVHLAAHQIAGIPRAQSARSWVKAEVENGAVKSVKLELPAGWPPDENDKKRLVAVVAAKAAIESPVPTWKLGGSDPWVRLDRPVPPPSYVAFADCLEAIAKCPPDKLFLGFGIGGSPVYVSLKSDSPHLAISMGTGAGKSNLAGLILLQILLRGGIGLVLDPKKMSYPWIMKDADGNLSQLPCVGYARSTAQLHAGMEWMGIELERRNDVAFAAMDTRGKVHASVGPPLFTIAEELNYAEDPLKALWQEMRDQGDPARSPAFTGLGAVSFAGRFVRMHEIIIGQMVTAAVTGRRDSSVKENCGIKMLARYGQKGWRIMCDDIPMPPSPEITGRIQVVTGRTVREVQVPEIDPVAARQMVLDCDMAKLPPTMPRCLVTGIPALAGTPLSPAAETVSAPVAVTSGPEYVGLREAVNSGELRPSTTLGSLRMARYRGQLPEHKDMRGLEKLYDLEELTRWDMAR